MNHLAHDVPSSPIDVIELRCEYSKNPLGIDSRIPRLSWCIRSDRRGTKQSAFQVLVSNSEDKLSADIGDIWDSDKTLSNRSFSVEYGGKELGSCERYFWKVKVWDEHDSPSNFSEISWWEMGLLDREDWKANWIEGGKILGTKFEIRSRPLKARAYITGLGFYELRINGRKVGDRVLDPAPSAAEKRVYYATFDVSDYLVLGTNSVRILLGKGRETQQKVLAQFIVDQDDGTSISLGTDGNWKVSNDTPVVFDDLYDGEKYDARLEESTNHKISWTNCKLADSSGIGEISSSAFFPPIRVTASLKPIKIIEPQPRTYVFDLGQNFSGWARLRVRGPRSSEVTMRFAEVLNSDGSINVGTNRAAKATDVYILSGSQDAEIF
ncbi:MAG: family 78 glycoside hydrolase catalytic domain, partial [Thaumarchaeota archaeon]|nr:family 78 glycoside hydrolase catalytic domain [Nitrososphaerota archaeon]